MKRRTTSLLFAVATGVPVAALAPTTNAAVPTTAIAVQPRVLPSGAPACGNVLWKMPVSPDPGCHEVHAAGVQIVGSLAAQAHEIGQVLAVFDGFGDRSLTVAEA